MKAKVTLKAHAGVPDYVTRAVQSWIDAGLGTEVRHPLKIELAPAPTVCTNTDRSLGFAVIWPHQKRPLIGIGCEPMPWCKSQRSHTRHILRCLTHEMGHYEQLRDGKPLTERGVEVRARRIRRDLKRAMRKRR